MTGEPAAPIATYRRRIDVPLERMFENALDWEHLPWLHRSTFSSIECLAAGRWGFRARVGLQPSHDELTIELRLDRGERRWVTETVDGTGAGAQIVSVATPTGSESIEVVVDFHVPDVSPAARDAVGAGYIALYDRLYDEDEWMMLVRHRRLAAARGRPGATREATIMLGAAEDVRARVPFRVEAFGTALRVVEVDGQLVAHGVVCPHLLGPLEDAPVCDGVVECPWHGYRYDVRTGSEVSGRPLRLATARVDVGTDGQALLVAAPSR